MPMNCKKAGVRRKSFNLWCTQEKAPNRKEKVKKFSGKLELTWLEYKVDDFWIKQYEFAAIPACWNPQEVKKALIFPEGKSFIKLVLV